MAVKITNMVDNGLNAVLSLNTLMPTWNIHRNLYIDAGSASGNVEYYEPE